MVRFAHISDVHLGGWKQPELQALNSKSFEMTIDKCIESNLDFILISGDLFDSAYPPIEILKNTFAQFKRLKDANLPCFIIAGSHDYSVSGKTFLDVLEHAGFCKNVYDAEDRNNVLFLNPTIFKTVAIYGYPGKKSGLEIEDLKRIKLQDAPGLFKIFMLHTTLEEANGGVPMESIKSTKLPYADYYALGHLHLNFIQDKFVYPGPIFPNNFQELEDLKNGSFYIVDTLKKDSFLEKIELKLKDVIAITIELNDAHSATEKIIKELEKHDISKKIVLLRLIGELQNGKNSDIKFSQIDEWAAHKNVYFMLRNTHDLLTKDLELDIQVQNTEDIEGETIKFYTKDNPSEFNPLISQLMNAISMEKQEGETVENFKTRIIEESKKVLNYK